MRQEVAFYDQRKTGELVNRLSADSEVMSKSLLENFASGMRRVIEGAGGLAVLFYLAPKLTLTMLAVVPPVFLAAMFYGRTVRQLSTQYVI
jgi:ABC-type multidrug transport system fused ATPase/permease subunit